MTGQVKLLLTTYFDGITHHLDIIKNLPVNGLHIDLCAGQDALQTLHQALPKDWVLSLGVINGRNVWKADLTTRYQQVVALKVSVHYGLAHHALCCIVQLI